MPDAADVRTIRAGGAAYAWDGRNLTRVASGPTQHLAGEQAASILEGAAAGVEKPSVAPSRSDDSPGTIKARLLDLYSELNRKVRDLEVGPEEALKQAQAAQAEARQQMQVTGQASPTAPPPGLAQSGPPGRTPGALSADAFMDEARSRVAARLAHISPSAARVLSGHPNAGFVAPGRSARLAAPAERQSRPSHGGGTVPGDAWGNPGLVGASAAALVPGRFMAPRAG